MQNPIPIQPIGMVQSDIKYRYESPRQGVLADKTNSVIVLNKHQNFEQALTGLEGFDRIWVVFLFHLNTNWKPMVTPPRHTRKKVGIFATRSPHRPSQIGLSCVKLERIEGLTIHISESDILDGSPVLDIKPYLPYSDSFPDAATGWAHTDFELQYSILYSETAEQQVNWIRQYAGINLKGFAKLQLEFNPTDNSRKRIEILSSSEFTLAYRTWRIIYSVIQETKQVQINRITSGYSPAELHQQSEDIYADKPLHKQFNETFSR